MPNPILDAAKPPYALGLLMAVQIICTAFFIGDVINDFQEVGWQIAADRHLYIELGITISLCAAVAIEMRYLMWLLRRHAHLERSASIANAAIHDVIEAHFEMWKLTPAEQDVATFLVKGLSIAEIAEIRGSAEGTVKSHLNAIYRKSETKGRGELLSSIIDSLMSEPEAGRKTTGTGAPVVHREDESQAQAGLLGAKPAE
jgi:DNA-binding CsgD family transcriptional regulator